MAALERYCLAHGINVAGYDRTPSELTAALEAEGVQITFEDTPDTIPAAFRDPATTMVVRTPAVPAESPQLQWFGKGGFEIIKRSQLLGSLTAGGRAVCVAGTHGKTTTTSMVAHILHCSPQGVNAFVGGVMRNYGTNYLINPESNLSAVEADEYDRSFHWLSPWVAVVTSADPDHLDIYGTEQAYREGFNVFTSKVRPGGALLLHESLPLEPRPQEGVRVLTYGRTVGDYHADNIRHEDGKLIFDFVAPWGTVKGVSTGVPVEVNVENAVAAIAAVDLAGALDIPSMLRAMDSFAGPKRRFEKLVDNGTAVMVDDYAHHPEELRASIRSMRALYPGRWLTVAFQPHLYSRTRDCAEGFAEVLSLADEVVLLPIYPARELPIPGVDSAMLCDGITVPCTLLDDRHDLPEYIRSHGADVLLTAGAGDISELLDLTAEALNQYCQCAPS